VGKHKHLEFLGGAVSSEDLERSRVFDFGMILKALAVVWEIYIVVVIVNAFQKFGAGAGTLMALFLVVAGGGLGIATWGWGCIFCMQAWNAVAVKYVRRWLASRQSKSAEGNQS